MPATPGTASPAVSASLGPAPSVKGRRASPVSGRPRGVTAPDAPFSGRPIGRGLSRTRRPGLSSVATTSTHARRRRRRPPRRAVTAQGGPTRSLHGRATPGRRDGGGVTISTATRLPGVGALRGPATTRPVGRGSLVGKTATGGGASGRRAAGPGAIAGRPAPR